MRLLCLVWSLLLVVSCSSDPGSGDATEGQCLTTLPGCPGSTCLGRTVRTCSEDGTRYEYQLCFNGICKDGLCSAAACTEPEASECVGPTTKRMCLPNMSREAEVECEAGNVCVAGACVPQTCQTGDVRCGWKALLTCNPDGSGWTNTACSEGQNCDPDNPSCVDVLSFCATNPGGARCADLATSEVCDNLGIKMQATACSDEEVCVGGFCQGKACGVSYEPDVVTPDTSSDVQPTDVIEDTGTADAEDIVPDLPPIDVPPLEKPAKAWVTITGGQFMGEKITFTSGKSANYVFKDTDLQVAMAKGMYLLEIHFAGIEEQVVGHFTSAEQGSVTPTILFNDGTHEQTEVQWAFMATAYDITLNKFEAPGGRVEGTFSGTLATEDGSVVLELTEGYFDVPRKQ